MRNIIQNKITKKLKCFSSTLNEECVYPISSKGIRDILFTGSGSIFIIVRQCEQGLRKDFKYLTK